MVNGKVAVSFDGIDLDDCIKEGLEFTGYSKCHHCNQIYYFQIHISKKVQLPTSSTKRKSSKINDYNVSIDFSGKSNIKMPELEGEPADSEGECVPCNGCTPNCTKKGK
jgi:hypothetical protein